MSVQELKFSDMNRAIISLFSLTHFQPNVPIVDKPGFYISRTLVENGLIISLGISSSFDIQITSDFTNFIGIAFYETEFRTAWSIFIFSIIACLTYELAVIG